MWRFFAAIPLKAAESTQFQCGVLFRINEPEPRPQPQEHTNRLILRPATTLRVASGTPPTAMTHLLHLGSVRPTHDLTPSVVPLDSRFRLPRISAAGLRRAFARTVIECDRRYRALLDDREPHRACDRDKRLVKLRRRQFGLPSDAHYGAHPGTDHYAATDRLTHSLSKCGKVHIPEIGRELRWLRRRRRDVTWRDEAIRRGWLGCFSPGDTSQSQCNCDGCPSRSIRGHADYSNAMPAATMYHRQSCTYSSAGMVHSCKTTTRPHKLR